MILIKVLCCELGLEEIVSSFIFFLVNEYEDWEGEIFYYMDFYCLNDVEEVFDIGIEEYLDSGWCCLIEWLGLIEYLFLEDIF